VHINEIVKIDTDTLQVVGAAAAKRRLAGRRPLYRFLHRRIVAIDGCV